jgi:hypothetical protein
MQITCAIGAIGEFRIPNAQIVRGGSDDEIDDVRGKRLHSSDAIFVA